MSQRDQSSDPQPFSTFRPFEKQATPVSGAPPKSPNPPADDYQPTVVGPAAIPARVIRGYRLMERLGGGAYGVVYRALSPGGVVVAVKEFRYPLGQRETKRELDALKLFTALHHPYL